MNKARLFLLLGLLILLVVVLVWFDPEKKAVDQTTTAHPIQENLHSKGQSEVAGSSSKAEHQKDIQTQPSSSNDPLKAIEREGKEKGWSKGELMSEINKRKMKMCHDVNY
jgi:ribosome-binding protein aMBF1 (putative translation factor)